MTRHPLAAVVLTVVLPLAAVVPGSAPSAAAAPEPAVPGDWSRHAPAGVFEAALSVSPTDPDLVYAALGEGMARSDDGGLTWKHLGVDEGFGGSFSIDNQVEVDPTTDSRVYASSYTGVRRSVDDGGSFSFVGTDPGTGLDSIVRAIGVDPGAGPADTRILATGYVQRVALSTDSGTTWVNKTGNAAAAGLGFGDASVVLHPTDPDVAFIGTDNVILRTVNLTAPTPTWAAIDTATILGNVFDMAIAGNRLLVATSTGQVFRSTDALVKTTPAPVWSAANIDRSGVAADLFTVGVAVFVSTGDGLFKTTDVTVSVPTWTEIGGGLPGSNSEAIAGTPDGSTLYAQAGTSIYRSENGGLSWVDRGGPVQRTVRDLDSGGGRTFAGSEIGMLRSLDGGLTWSVVPSTAGQEVIALAVAPSAPARVFARLDGDVRRSTDGGTTFAAAVPTAPDDVVALAVDPTDADVAWAVGGFEEVYRTDDGGATWDTIPPALLPDSFRAEDIEIARAVGATPSAVFLSGDEGFVLASVDDGASWVPQSTGLPGGSNDVGDVAVDPADPRHLVAAVDLNGQLYESANSGGTWTPVPGTDEEENPSALEVVQIDAVTFAPDGSILIATGWGFAESGRVYRSGDGGATFTAFDPPMDEVYNDAFEILADDQGVHVATQRSGVLDLVRSANVRAQTSAPATVAVGAPLVVTVAASSLGPDPATGVTVRVPRPAGVVVSTATVTGGTCTLGATVVCRPGSLPATVRLNGRATTTGAKRFTATIDAAQVDTVPGNDTSTRTVSARKAATRLTLGSRPTADTTSPHTFTLSGTLARTDRRALTCSGQVTLTVRNGTRTVTTRSATLRRASGTTCRYSTVLTLRSAPARTLTVTASHPGSALLTTSRSTRVTIRLRR